MPTKLGMHAFSATFDNNQTIDQTVFAVGVIVVVVVIMFLN